MSENTIKRSVVRLSADERETLNALIDMGEHPAGQVLKARILLKADVSEADEGWSDGRIVKALDTSPSAVLWTRQGLVEEGFEAVLTRQHSPHSARPRIFDGAAEAKLIALACSAPPTGRRRWTLQSLEEKVVELDIVERASDNTIGRTQKNLLNPHLKKQWVIPPDASAAFVTNMEDVLDAYHWSRDLACPMVCLDETSKQLIAETRVPITAKPGRTARYDYEYERNGTANLFMLFAPLEGWRHVEITETPYRCRFRSPRQEIV